MLDSKGIGWHQAPGWFHLKCSGWNCQPWPSRSQNWMFVYFIIILSRSQQFPTSSSQNQVELDEWATGHIMHWKCIINLFEEKIWCLNCHCVVIFFLAATKQLYEWSFPSVCLSVRLSVTPIWPCSWHLIIMKLSGMITFDKSKRTAKGQGQRSKVKVTEVMTPLGRFRTLTPVRIHGWQRNFAHSLNQHRRGALLFLAATKQLYEWFSPSVCPSVCLSVCPSVCHTFLTMFPSSYHHEIFWSYYQWQKWRPCKRSRSEVKGQGHRGHNPTSPFPDCNSSLNSHMMMRWCI